MIEAKELAAPRPGTARYYIEKLINSEDDFLAPPGKTVAEITHRIAGWSHGTVRDSLHRMVGAGQLVSHAASGPAGKLSLHFRRKATGEL